MSKQTLLLKGILTFLLFHFLILQSCKKDETDTSRHIQVGALIPLSGAGSSPGTSGYEGMQLALNDVRAYLTKNNPDWTFEVLTEDTQTDTLVALEKYNVLKAKGVKMILGPFSSAVLQSLKNHADRDGILLVSPASVAGSLSVENDNVFRIIPDVTSQGEAMTALLVDDEIEIIIPLVRDDVWGRELLETTSTQFAAAGFDTDAAVFYNPGAVDVSAQLQELSQKLDMQLSQRDASKIGIYMLSYGEGYDFLKMAKDLPQFAEVKWYGSSAFAENNSILADIQTAGFAADRQLWCPSFGLLPEAASIWMPLQTQLEARLNRIPEIFAFTSYDALWLIAKTYIESQANADVALLKENFVMQAGQYFGATGWTRLNAAGDRNMASYDFWGLALTGNTIAWENKAVYNNITKTLSRNE